ncbi:hypothetical protein [Saliphagus sp. LR7]|uniref:hypothetical protein n=1 Tax=Saliphagus sp. LR7 TaxID=2282654 RepID=UPI000DF7BDBF|nr:hypothetical protein [Saliphagus sp. LR7]
MRRVSWFRVILLIGLVPGLVLAPGIGLDGVTAQEGGNETDDDGPVPDVEDDNESDDGGGGDENASGGGILDGGRGDEVADQEGDDADDNESDDEGGIGRGGGGFGFSQLDPRNIAVAMVNHVVEWIDETAQSTFEAILEGSIEFATSTPTMDNDGWMGVFGTPTDDHYNALYDEIYIGAVSPVVLFFMVLSIMVVATILPFGTFFNSYQASSWALMIMGGIVAFALAWPLTSLLHLAADSIASWFGPTTEELTANLPQLGSASVAAAGGIYLFGWLKAIVFALLWGFRWTLLYMVMPFLFPFAISFALLGPHKIVRRIGSLFIWSYIGLLIMPIPAAVLFSAAISIEWGFNASGMAGVILTLGTLVIAILVPLAIMKAMFVTNALMAGSAGAIGAGLQRRSRMGYDVKTPQQARHAGGRARDIVSGGAAASRSRAVNIGERIGLISTEKEPSLDPRVHKRGPGAGSTQAERTTMVRQASRDREQASSARAVGSIGGRRDDVDAYRQVSD